MKQTLYIADLRSNCSNGISTGHFFTVAKNYKQMFENVCNVKIAGGPIFKNHFKKSDFFSAIVFMSKNLFREPCNLWKLFRYFKKRYDFFLQFYSYK